jgi:hypothetical protein
MNAKTRKKVTLPPLTALPPQSRGRSRRRRAIVPLFSTTSRAAPRQPGSRSLVGSFGLRPQDDSNGDV